MPDRRSLLFGGVAGVGTLLFGSAEADQRLVESAVNSDREPDRTLPLWTEGPPGGVPLSITDQVIEREDPLGLRNRAALSVATPTLSVFDARGERRGSALIIPGGGYARVVIDKEGYELARLLSQRGIDAHVLRYRLPSPLWAAGRDAPLEDALQAMRMIDRQAETVAIGFSAGGHLAGQLANRADARLRPGGVCLGYPVITMEEWFVHEGSRAKLLGGAEDDPAVRRKYSLEHNVSPEAPPHFLFSATDDEAVPVDNTLAYFAALRGQGIPADIHLFSRGGHGFALRYTGGLTAQSWPWLMERWAVNQEFWRAREGLDE